MKKLSQRYLDLHIQTKLTLILLLVVVIPAVIVIVFFYGRIYDMVVSYTIQQEQEATAKTAPLIEEMVQEVVDASESVEELDFYSALFHQPVDASIEDLAESDEAEEFAAQVEKIEKDSPVNAVRIYLDLPEEAADFFTGKYTKEIFAPMWQAKGTYWYGIMQGTQDARLYCPSFYLGTKEQELYGDLAYMRSTSIYYEGETLPVYLAFYYSSEDILDILSGNLSLENSVSYIINDRDNIVASSDVALSGIYWLNYNTIGTAFMSSNNFVERTILDEKVYVGYYSIAGPDWFLVTVLPSAPLIAQGNWLMLRFVLIYLAVLLLALILAVILSRSITKRISSVSTQMNTAREGPPKPMESPEAHDEVGDLIETYNYMAGQINDLMKEQAEAAEDLRIAEFNSLQAQINPHFLYNTMDMINWLAKQGRTSEISSAVQDLSRFYKLTLSKKETITTVENEVEHITIYVRLQNMRFHDGITLITDIPDDMMEYQIPKLTLQPVVENAILHGILEKETKTGTIVLTGWMEGNDIVLLISDDGVGMSEETLKTILDGKEKSESSGTNIAIYNIHRRLQLLYGNGYGLHYSSEPGKGTDVQIRFPAYK